jgi:hypothetical protein
MKIKLKWPIIFFLTLPPIAGASALYTLGRGKDLRNELLGCYYVVRDNDASTYFHLSNCISKSCPSSLLSVSRFRLSGLLHLNLL